MKINRVLSGDAAEQLAKLPDDSIDTIITSPPYFRLRNYGHDEQLGLETHVDDWVDKLLAVADQLARVLKPTGSFWLNLGDTYSRSPRSGAPTKALALAPERLLLALSSRGWIVRNKVVWAKTNPMPSSVSDRLSTTHESLYFLTREPRYFFDLDAIRIPHRSRHGAHPPKTPPADYPPTDSGAPDWAGPNAGNNSGLGALKRSGRPGHPLGKNPGDVWTMATAAYRGAHFATFPTALVERPLLATCPARVCARCGLPWQRQPHRTLGHLAVAGRLAAQCHCRANHHPGMVLDPFFGVGTVALVAEANNRSWLGIELNDDYRRQAETRIQAARHKRQAAA